MELPYKIIYNKVIKPVFFFNTKYTVSTKHKPINLLTVWKTGFNANFNGFEVLTIRLTFIKKIIKNLN